MGKLILNGRNYSGLVDAQGVFIDTDNIIVPRTSYTGSMSYTATQDCFVQMYVCNKVNAATEVTINGQRMYMWWNSSVVSNTVLVSVMKGQTIAVVNANASESGYYVVFGIQMGSEVTFLSEYASACYDTDEREVGCWVDGKPLYQITIDIAPLPNNTTKEIQLDADIERIISMHGYGIDSNDKWDVFFNDIVPTSVSASIRVFFNTTTKKLYINSGVNLTSYTEAYVTIQYTKTTDTAGSGSLTPTATPTHHYSTNEQVIGTWTNGKPCYEITLEGSGSYASNTEHIIALPLNAENVRIMSGFVDIGTDWLPVSLTLGVGSSLTNGVYCYPNKTNGIHLFSSAWTFTNYSIVIQYTKSTD